MKPILGSLLAFCDAQREARFQLFYAQKRSYFDRIGLYACLLQLFPGTVVAVNQGRSCCTWLVLLSWVLHIAHGWLMWRRSALYLHHRTWCVAGLLIFGRAVTAALIPGCTTQATATMRLCYKTGIIPLVWYALVMPLPFCLQLTAQLGAVAVYQRRLASSSCSKLMLDPAMLQWLHSFWESCRKTSAALLMLLGFTGDADIAFWAAGGGGASATNALNAVASDVASVGGFRDDIVVCHQTVLLMLVVFGVLLPLPLCYVWELRLRKQFYAQELLAAEGAQQQQQQQQRAIGHNAASFSSSSSSQVLRGGESWQDALHRPLRALVQYVLAASMIVLIGLLKLGPFLL